jgi:hypothetical protein
VNQLPLPAELVSLVHHVELNDAGWWDRTVQRLVIAAIWAARKPLSIDAISAQIRKAFGLSLAIGKISDQVNRLSADGTLVRFSKWEFKISESQLQAFERALGDAENNAALARERFTKALGVIPKGIDPQIIWNQFNSDVLLPLIREMGARTYELISGTTQSTSSLPDFSAFLEKFPQEVRQNLRSSIVAFLDPKDPEVRSYVLRRLNAYFSIEAGNLGDSTINALAKGVRGTPTFRIFVDTNFVFSVLGLRDNPSNQAAAYLMNLIVDVAKKIKISMYALPVTVDEAQVVLRSELEALSGLRVTPNIGEGAVTDLTGFARRVAEESVATRKSVSAEAFLKPYEENLIVILRSKGIELYNEQTDFVRKNPAFAEDLRHQLEYERQRYGAGGKRTAEMEHDLTLWHFIQSKRPVRCESPLDAEYWVATIDFRFLSFDRWKLQGRRGMPVCAHPTALIQMLQFWVPRTVEFEEAIVGSLRLPLLSQEFDAAAERISIRILNIISRYENAADLPPATVSSILMNTALRQRLSLEREGEKQVQLVREAIVEQYRKTQEQLDTATRSTQKLEKDLSEKSAEFDHLQRELRLKTAQIEDVSGNLSSERVKAQELGVRLADVEARLTQKEQAERDRRKRTQLALFSMLMSSCLAILLLLAWLLQRVSPPLFAGNWRVLYLLALLIWVWAADLVGSRQSTIAAWPPFARIHSLKVWIFYVLFVGAAGNALWDFLKDSLTGRK